MQMLSKKKIKRIFTVLALIVIFSMVISTVIAPFF